MRCLWRIRPDIRHTSPVRKKADKSRGEQVQRSEATYSETRRFLTRWVELERLLWEVAPHPKPQRPGQQRMREMLAAAPAIIPELLPELDQFTFIRNLLVHGNEELSAQFLAGLTDRMTELINALEKYRQEMQG
jgi:hypothetical protein